MSAEEQSEQQPPVKKSRMDDTSEGEPAEIAIQNDGATSDEQITELKISTMDKKEELNELKLEMVALKDEFASLEEKYQKEMAELKLKNQKLTEGFEEKIKKLEERIQMNQQKISETENQIMVQIREMKVQLPLENWHDLLAFVPRSQLGNVVSQIGDRQFAYIIQSFLHDPVREITLGYMRIIAPRPDVSNDQPMVKIMDKAAINMPYWPMPGNIRNFKQIDLNYVDTSVLNFLQKFQENSLLTDVNIYIDGNFVILDEYEDLPQALTKIAPFITSIDSIYTQGIDLDLLKMVYYATETQLLLMEMMAKTRILLTDCAIYDSDDFESWENKSDLCCSWLCTPRNDGKPRMLKSNYPIYVIDCADFIESIKKDFEMANDPASFIIYTKLEYDCVVEEISLENVKTNEKLVIKKMDDDKMLISRYPLNAAKSWIDTNEKEIVEWNDRELDRKIYMDGDLTITI